MSGSETFDALPQRERRRRRKRTVGSSAGGGGEAGEGGEGGALEPEAKRVFVETTERGKPLSAADFAAQLEAEAEAAAAIAGEFQYEYLDHTADVQIHAWGDSVGEAYAQTALGLMGYITDPSSVSVDPSCDTVVEAKGHDPLSLLFHFLDEVLFTFASDDMVARECIVEHVVFPELKGAVTAGDGARKPAKPGAAGASMAMDTCQIRVRLRGEKFNLAKHPQGTEIKAITFSNMQVLPPTSAPEAVGEEEGHGEGEKGSATSSAAEGGGGGGDDEDHPPEGLPVPDKWNIYAIVDI